MNMKGRAAKTRRLGYGILPVGFLLFALQALSCGPEPQRMVDASIEQQIQPEVPCFPELTGSQAEVYAESNVVMLSGTVSLYEQKMKYEEIAWQMADVEGVENMIQVQPVQSVSDAALEAKIKKLIASYHDQLHHARFTVENGIVVIHGTFENHDHVQFLLRNIAKIRGVVSIVLRVEILCQYSSPGQGGNV